MRWLAKPCSRGTSADRLLKAGASSAERLTVRSVLLSTRAIPAKRCMVLAMCGHPPGDNIKFHPPLGGIPAFGFGWARELALLCQILAILLLPKAITVDRHSISKPARHSYGLKAIFISADYFDCDTLCCGNKIQRFYIF